MTKRADDPVLSKQRPVADVLPSALVALTTDFAHLPGGGEPYPSAQRMRVEMIDRPHMSMKAAFVAIVKKAREHDVVVLDGSVGIRGGYLDQFATAVLRRRRSTPNVVISDCTWKRGSWWLDRFACRAGVKLFDSPRVTYCVLSKAEASIFPGVWSVDPRRVEVVPWCHTLSDQELEAPTSDSGAVFAGGDSMRDYPLLVEAAGRISAKVTIATRRPETIDRRNLPANLQVASLTHGQFVSALRNALAVVVPLPPALERSAGQTTYLNAMALGKLVVVTDSLGASDYIEHEVTGLIVPPGDAEALAGTLRWVTDPANRKRVREMGERAREVATTVFSPHTYVENLLRVAARSVQAPSA